MKRAIAVILTALVAASCLVLAGCSGMPSLSAIQQTPLTAKAFITSDLIAGEPQEPEEQPTATVMIYLNGSDLESNYGEATIDIAEMISSGIGDNANVVIQTLGTSKWQDYGIASDHTQRYAIEDGELQLVDDSLGQLDTTKASTLSDFIAWGAKNYPAQRYMLILWDHGAGPVWGFGYDEFQGDYAALTLDEIQSALQDNADTHFDFIGMDCCLMSSLETCCVLAPFCDYALLSEDFEPGVGWSYKRWMGMLEDDPTISTVDLGTAIVDDMVEATAADSQNGDATLALVDVSVAPVLYSAWVDFAYENKDALLGTNYSQETLRKGRALGDDGARQGADGSDCHGWDAGQGAYGYGSNDNGWGARPGGGGGWGGGQGGWGGGQGDNGYNYGYNNGGGYSWDDLFSYWDYDASSVTMSDYFVTDIMAVASSIDSDTSKALESALGNAIVHYDCTSGEVGMTGMGVTLPYGDAEFYDELVQVFGACGFDDEYLAWLEDFVDASGVDDYYNYQEFDEAWPGWENYSDEFNWLLWALANEGYWIDYESYGWYDNWYDDFFGPGGQGSGNSGGNGWVDFFYDGWITDPGWR